MLKGKERYDLIQWQRSQMIEISERRWAAGWMEDIERDIWTDQSIEAEMIRDAAEQTGVWWRSSSEYVTLDEWRQLYSQRYSPQPDDNTVN